MPALITSKANKRRLIMFYQQQLMQQVNPTSRDITKQLIRTLQTQLASDWK